MELRKGDEVIDRWGRKGECRGFFQNHSVTTVIVKYHDGKRLYLREKDVRKKED